MASIQYDPALLEEAADYFHRYKKLLAAMDKSYGDIAGAYGFHCTGCKDNCCRTHFYHHTLLEAYTILEGLATLSRDQQESIRRRAGDVIRRQSNGVREGRSTRMMCPLNQEQQCLLYMQRPMICRLHGIPHEFQPPGRPRIQGEGCDAFIEQCGDMGYIKFDRTGMYMALAELEKEFRQCIGRYDKVKLTIAEIISG